MPTLDLNRENLGYFSETLGQIDPDVSPEWGQMDCLTLMRHLRRAIEVSLEEVKAEDKSIPGVRWLLKKLFFEWMTNWPKGKIKASPIFIAQAERSFHEERDLLLDALQRFVDELERNPARKTINPFLGPIPISYWSHIHGRHYRHHFRQFGVLNN